MSTKQNHFKYIVTISDIDGIKTIGCNSIEDTWEAINTRSFRANYRVSSPIGLPVSEFVPF